MSIKVKHASFGRVFIRTLTVSVSLALLAGFVGGTPAAKAQAADDKAAKTDKKVLPLLGEDTIDPNQAIKSDFIVNVSVVGEPDPSGNYAVDQAGNVSIKYAGIMTPVSVKGLTPAQAADAIAKFLKIYVKSPQVTVSIVSVPRPVVFVSGAVKNTGPVIIPQDTTLVDVLSRAEWTDIADLTQVRISRKSTVNGVDKTVVMVVKFDKYIKVGEGQTPDESQNPILQDKDRVFIPFKSLPGSGVVSVGGEVTKPQQSIPLRTNPPMTVREVINLVGGTNSTANRKAVSIRRPSVDRPLVIDLDKAEQGDLVNNIEIKPDDAVYVEKLENNAYINVNGGFVKTGKFVYDKRTTLTQAVMEASGPAPFSKWGEGKIFRHPDNDPKNTKVISFNWKDISKSKSPDIELLPGDSVWMTPGTPPMRPPVDIFTIMGAFSQGLYIYNNLTGRYFGGNGAGTGIL